MWGATPGTYRNKSAVDAVCLGYMMEEEGSKWIVVQKLMKDAPKPFYYYKPCDIRDIEAAKIDSFIPCKGELD